MVPLIRVSAVVVATAGTVWGLRRYGFQGAYINNTLWFDGGVDIWDNGTVTTTCASTLLDVQRDVLNVYRASDCTAQGLTKLNLSTDFAIPPGPVYQQLPKPQEVPNVAYGIAWSNQFDTLWLFGGTSSTDHSLENSIWRFKPGTSGEDPGTWTKLDSDSANLSRARPGDGAGCSVPSRSRGYYLGGSIMQSTAGDDTSQTVLKYQHTMIEFDMDTEKTTMFSVPEFVPVIGQSLVYLNAGVSGILVALGGKREMNGTLSLAPMTEIYIYDIHSGSWMTQTTTDILGGTNYFYKFGTSHGVGIPQKRYHMCAVAMSSLDKTSHNIYIFGGRNDTNTPDDSWVVTLPSAVWIRFNLSDTTNYPKAGGSCDPINGRYVHLAGGCYIEPGQPCASYGWNPLSFDLSLGDWNWKFGVDAKDYFVPQSISSVIGGDALGHALHSSPIFTDFGDSALAQILGPPLDTGSSSDGSVIYHQAPLKVLLPILLCSTLVFPIQRFVNFLRYSIIKRPRSKRNWKPRALRTPYLVGLLTLTAVLISMVLILESVSSLPDPDPSHRTGGVDSDGHWSGDQFTSVFIPAPKSGKLPRGLISFYVDQSYSGQWSRKNAVQRVSVGIYVMWTYIPSIVGVLYGLLWMVVDDEIKRIEKYRQLSLPEGCKGKSSLCLDYHSFWAPLSIIDGVKYQQWTVAFSSTGFVLASIVVPNVQNYVFQWVLYSGATLSWGGTYSWQVGLVDHYWSRVLVAILAMNLACLVGIMVMTATQDTGLSEDILGLAGHAGLILDKASSDLGFEVTDDEAAFSEVCTKLFERRFQLSEENGFLTLNVYAGTTYTKDSRIEVAMKFLRQYSSKHLRRLPPLFRKIWKPFGFVLSRAGDVVLIAGCWITDCPHSFFFHPLALFFWLSSLIFLLSATIYVLVQMSQSSQTLLQNYSMPWPTNLYLVVGVLVQSVFNLLEHNVRGLTALDTLREGYCSPAVLWDDYATGIPVATAFSAFNRGQHLLGYVLLASFTSYIYTIMLGSLQVSASYYGSTTYRGDLAGVIMVLATNLFILAVSLAVAWRYGRAKFLPRFPGVMASVLPYVLSSEMLRRDLRAVRGKERTGEKIKMLEDLDRRYAFGHFRNANESPGVKHLGVERNYMEGSDSRAHVSRSG